MNSRDRELLDKAHRAYRAEAPTDIIVVSYNGALRAISQARIEEREAVEALREALQQIDQWAKAYPVDMFPEPDLDTVKEILADHGHLNQMDRMHAAWARHVVEGIGKIASDALKGLIPVSDDRDE